MKKYKLLYIGSGRPKMPRYNTPSMRYFMPKQKKAGLQTSFEKTKFMTSMKTAPTKMTTDYGQINRTGKFSKFIYLGEVIHQKRMSQKKEPFDQELTK